MTVPFLDLQKQFAAIRTEVMAEVERVIESQRFIMGESVTRFERAIAEFCQSRFAVTCASGTDALLLSLRAMELEPGDEVVTTPFTFFATAGAVVNAGGTPVFADIDPRSFNLDPASAAAAVTQRTRALIPVHLFGLMARLEEFVPLCATHGLELVEDAAQAIGGRRRIGGEWRMAGGVGWTGAFSFFPSKNLGGWGDGGMILTQDEELDTLLRLLRTHGGAKQYHHDRVGTNSRLDAIQAAVLLGKLPHLAAWNAARRNNAAWYDDALSGCGEVQVPGVDPDAEHVYHQYTIRALERDRLREHLAAKGIGSAVYYPVPLHRQPCFAGLGYREGQLPHAERAAREVLSLPVGPELTESQREQVVVAICEFYQ